MNKAFRALTEQLHDTLWDHTPFRAPGAGVPARDREVDRYDPGTRAAYRAKLRDLLRQLKSFDQQPLAPGEALDLAVATGQIQAEIRFDEDIKVYERNAEVYPSSLLSALCVMAIREYAPEVERGKAMLERLKQVPQYLDVATHNLKQGYDIPRIWTEIAIEEIESADRVFRETLVGSFAARCGKLEEELADAAEGARRHLARFRGFLKDDLLPRCDGAFAVGRDFFDFLLEKVHGLHLKTKDVLAIGEEEVAAARAEIERLIPEVFPPRRRGGSPPAPADVWRELKKQRPAAKDVLPSYAKEMARARDFVRRRDLVTIPDGESLKVIETPSYARPLIPYAAYMPPAPFESRQEGFFWVTPVDLEAPKAKQQEQLEGHNLLGLPVTALHEAYPGHHLQLCHANRIQSKVRRVFGTPVFEEGWALYCEELMHEEGFYDAEVRLLQLKDRLWRACRVVIDVKLHLQQMSFDDAVSMLVDVAGLERVNAVSEVKRYTLTPTQPMSYMLGKREILRIRDEVQRQKGDRFKLKDFHDKLLSYGSIPPSLVREAMLR